jgi:hypothetical protein
MPPVAIELLPSAISELFAQASLTGKITLADRYGILAALLQESLNEEEICCLNRLLYALRKGRIQVVDELSSIQ